MKRLFIFFIILLSIAYCSPLFAQGWQWASGTVGGAEGYGNAVDPWGNVYSSGYAGSTLKFPGFSLPEYGICGTVIAKYDPTGNFVWAKTTNHGFAKPVNITCDNTGNLYLYGYYTGDSITIDSFTLHNPAQVSMLYLIKFAPSGKVLFARNICPGSPPGNILVYRSDIYMTFVFDTNAITISPFTLHNSNPAGNTSDFALVKFDSSGNVLAAKSWGSAGNEIAYVAVSPAGKIYLAGTSTSPAITFGPYTMVNADSSMFIVRLDSAYNTLWAKNETGIGKVGSWVSAIAVDSSESAYICGSWRPKAFFGTQVLEPDTVCNVYLVKYDSSGNISWLNTVTGNGQLGGVAVITDLCGNVWIAGGMGDQTPGHHGSNYIIVGGQHIDSPRESRDPMFLAEWRADGSYVKAAVLPTGGDDEISIGADAAGNIYVSTDFWEGPYHIAGSFLYDPVQPSENIFIVKYLNNTADTSFVRNLICISDSAVLKAPPGYPYYRWDDGRTDTSITVYKPGTYKLYGTGNCGSGILMDIFTVAIGKKDTVYQNTDTLICEHAHTVLYAPAGYTPYLWSNGDTTQTDTIAAGGTYWVVASGTCQAASIIDTFHVADTSIDLGFSLGHDTVACAPLLLGVPAMGYNYLWQDGSKGNTDIATQTGLYYLTISVLSCYNSDSIRVSFPNLFQQLHDTVLCKENPANVKLTANVPPGATALWSTGATADSISVNAAGTYWITVTEDACMGTDTMTLASVLCTCEAIFPAAFTPNGDGKNDTYGPILDKRCDIFDYSFTIYNRWGNMVFSAHNMNEKWDGKYMGVPQDVGTFMYSLQYCASSIYNKHVYKGDLLLVR